MANTILAICTGALVVVTLIYVFYTSKMAKSMKATVEYQERTEKLAVQPLVGIEISRVEDEVFGGEHIHEACCDVTLTNLRAVPPLNLKVMTMLTISDEPRGTSWRVSAVFPFMRQGDRKEVRIHLGLPYAEVEAATQTTPTETGGEVHPPILEVEVYYRNHREDKYCCSTKCKLLLRREETGGTYLEVLPVSAPDSLRFREL
jgi:hypothetical protein